MRTLISTIIVALASATPALAASGNDAKGSGILIFLFLGFAALIIVFQFIPGMVLFASMLKGLFTSAHKKSDSLPGTPGRK